MSKTPWTAGPWNLSCRESAGDNYAVITLEADRQGFRGQDYMDVSGYCSVANALLIVEAPAMAAALERWSYHLALGDLEERNLRKETDAILARIKGEG